MPAARIALYTNGDYLTPDLLADLIPSVDHFVISQHGKTLARGALAALESKAARSASIRVKTAAHIEQSASNRGGLNPLEQLKTRKACGVVMNELHINAHGQVVLCCEDYLAEVALGNAARLSIEDIWTNARRLQIHRSNIRGEFELDKCRTCGFGRSF